MNNEQTMFLHRRAQLHAALGDITRLRIALSLIHSDRSPVELSTTLGVPSNLLAHHIDILVTAGLIHRTRSEGDRRRTYLCLEGRARDLIAASQPQEVDEVPDPERVVFVCTANTARSHLAAALWRNVSPLAASSAGTHPGARIHRGAVATARRHQLELPDVAPRPVDDTLTAEDLVITVCDRAHEQVGAMAWAHWSIPDPVAAATPSAFDAAVDALRQRIEPLARYLEPSSATAT